MESAETMPAAEPVVRAIVPFNRYPNPLSSGTTMSIFARGAQPLKQEPYRLAIVPDIADFGHGLYTN
ncbi:hypothetical protein ACFFF7_04165 [Novosphingobium aquiterrae]|uniref:Uncharacterized protein n=1 Tax=Novosphingobium aquiterrae TaxID=624388 RepID=A0ABV6PHQ3_9SPHN